MLWLFVGPTGVYLLDFFCSGIQFNLLLSQVWYLIVSIPDLCNLITFLILALSPCYILIYMF